MAWDSTQSLVQSPVIGLGSLGSLSAQLGWAQRHGIDWALQAFAPAGGSTGAFWASHPRGDWLRANPRVSRHARPGPGACPAGLLLHPLVLGPAIFSVQSGVMGYEFREVGFLGEDGPLTQQVPGAWPLRRSWGHSRCEIWLETRLPLTRCVVLEKLVSSSEPPVFHWLLMKVKQTTYGRPVTCASGWGSVNPVFPSVFLFKAELCWSPWELRETLGGGGPLASPGGPLILKMWMC